MTSLLQNPIALFKGANDEYRQQLIETIRDHQFANGSLVKVPPRSGNVGAYPIGVAVYPTCWPRRLFEEAKHVQGAMNELYIKVATNEEWLENVLSVFEDSDSMACVLWDVHCRVKEEGRFLEQHIAKRI